MASLRALGVNDSVPLLTQRNFSPFSNSCNHFRS
jgi:hypothetical protein